MTSTAFSATYAAPEEVVSTSKDRITFLTFASELFYILCLRKRSALERQLDLFFHAQM